MNQLASKSGEDDKLDQDKIEVLESQLSESLKTWQN